MCMAEDWGHCKEKNWLLTFPSILTVKSDLRLRSELRKKVRTFHSGPHPPPWLWKRVDERWWLNQKHDLLCCFDSLLTDLWREHHCSIKHRQETAFCEAQFYSTNLENQGETRIQTCGRSSPGWRVWTVCFGLCVFWPATLCSQHAATRPRKKCLYKHRWRPETRALPLRHGRTFNQTFNLFYIDWYF